jgi:hypothetical protein
MREASFVPLQAGYGDYMSFDQIATDFQQDKSKATTVKKKATTATTDDVPKKKKAVVVKKTAADW